MASGGYFGGLAFEPIVVSGTESNPVSLPAGTYYWQVNYSGDANNAPAISPCTAEVETITGSQTLTTVSTNLSGPGTTGASIMVLPDTAVTDTATLSGTNAASAGGTASYTVYSDSACTDVIANAGTVDVSDGVVPASTPVTLGVGTYYWQASYSGDATNAAATSPCISETETVASPSVITLSTTLYAPSVQGPSVSVPLDTAVHDGVALSGNNTATAGGTVTYTVYSDSACTDVVANAGTFEAFFGEVSPSNPVSLATTGNYYWQASYSGSTFNLPSTSPCTAETESVTSGQTSTALSTYLDGNNGSVGTSVTVPAGTAVTDSAYVRTSGTEAAGGSVTYTVYSDSACTDLVANAGTVDVTDGRPRHPTRSP